MTTPTPLSPIDPATDQAIVAAARAYFASRRDRVDEFARITFGPRGTMALHRRAIGWDLLRAPVNILLAMVYVGQRLVGLVLSAFRLKRAAIWLRDHPVLLATDVGAEVERRIIADLLELPVRGRTGRDALAEAVLSAPQVRDVIRTRPTVADANALAADVLRTVGDYAGTRSAVADMTTALATLGVGAIIFKSVTPGMISIAPSVAATIAYDTAIADFPLGGTMGAAWYWAFPTEASLLLSTMALTGLVMIAATVSAFAGIVADPVQVWLGIHRRRLLRLIDALEADFTGTTAAGFAAREHYLARVMDLADAGVSVLRHLRG